MSVSTSTISSGSVGVYSTESPGSCPNRDTGIRSGHGWLRCGGTNSAELAAGGQGRLINQYEAAA